MKDLRASLVKIIEKWSPLEGFNLTPVPGVYCIKYSQVSLRRKTPWRASFGVMAQGGKELILDNETFRFDETDYVATPVSLPVVSRISRATPEKPFLSLLIDMDPIVLSEVAASIDASSSAQNDDPLRGVFTDKVNDKILNATLRLVELFAAPEEARALGPLVIRELLFHLLKGTHGSAIHQFVRAGSKMHKISQAIYTLKADPSEEADVEALAKAANMSRSAFFKAFKDVTSVSPIQYQKRLRLHEARRLMTEDGETAERSAYRVGYKSASQFSREYSRMFGNSPLRDARKIKTTSAMASA